MEKKPRPAVLTRLVIAIISVLVLLSSCSDLPQTPTAHTAPGNGPDNLAFALLADNRLLAVRAEDGTVVTDTRLGAAPAPAANRLPGHYMAPSRDGKTLYVLLPGAFDQADRLAKVDTTGGQILATYALARSEGRLAGLDL